MRAKILVPALLLFGLGLQSAAAWGSDPQKLEGAPALSEAPIDYGLGSSFTELVGPGCKPSCGKVLVAGGLANGGRPPDDTQGTLSSAAIFDPLKKTWTETGSLRQGRAGHFAALLSGPRCGQVCGKVLVFGGLSRQDGAESMGFKHATTAELFDPRTGSWSTAKALSEGAEQIVALTGPNCGARCGQVLALANKKASLYNPVTERWQAAPGPTVPRLGSNATLIDGKDCASFCGKVLVAGGVKKGAPKSSELYDPASNSWALGPAPALSMHNHGSVALADGKILAIGSTNAWEDGFRPPESDPMAPEERRIRLTVSQIPASQLFDPLKKTWSVTGLPKYNPNSDMGPGVGTNCVEGDCNTFAPIGDTVRILFPREFLAPLSSGSVLAFGDRTLFEIGADGRVSKARSRPDYSIVQRFDPLKKDPDFGFEGSWEVIKPLDSPSARILALKCVTPESVLAAGERVTSSDPANAVSVAPHLYSPGQGGSIKAPGPEECRGGNTAAAKSTSAKGANTGPGLSQGRVAGLSAAGLLLTGAVTMAVLKKRRSHRTGVAQGEPLDE